MGWEGIHLVQFCLRAARYGSCELSASSPDVTLESLRLRTGARFTYEYDLNIPWCHEVRLEERLEPVAGQAYPTCIAGHAACPPEDCGGPAGYHVRREAWRSLDAFEDIHTMADIAEQAVLERRPEVLDDADTRWGSSRLWRAHRGARAGRACRSRGERSTPACVAASIGRSCISRAEPPDAMPDAMPHEQVGRKQGRLVPMPMLDGRDQGMGGRGGDLIEFAPQHASRRFGIEPGGREALVPEEALHVGDIHAEGEQLRRHRMAQQMRVDALRHARRASHFAHDLADPLAGVDIRRGPGSSLATGEQRTGAADTNMQLEQLGELAPDRHFPALASLAPPDDDDTLGEADVLGPDLDKLRHARASLQQGLQQKPGPAAPDIGLIDEPQLFLDGQAVDRGAAIGRRLQAGPLPGGFEHRLALKIVEALPDQDGGDRRDGAFDRTHDEFAERGSECKLMAETPPAGQD